MLLLSDLLGGNGATSVLGQKLQFGTKQATYVSAFYQPLSYDDTTFGLVIVPVPGVGLQEAEDAMDNAIAEFMAEGVDAEQLARIKSQMLAAQIYARDSVNGLARRYGSALTSGLTLEDIAAWPDIIQATTAEDIMAAAERIFDDRTSVTGWLTKPETKEVTQ